MHMDPVFPRGFRAFPILFLQSGYPLKISIYVWSPENEREPILFRKKGDTLPLEELLYLRGLPHRRVLALSNEVQIATDYYKSDPLYKTTAAKK